MTSTLRHVRRHTLIINLHAEAIDCIDKPGLHDTALAEGQLACTCRQSVLVSLQHHKARSKPPVLAEVKSTVAQDRPRSCARTSSFKVTWELLVLFGTESHLLITITQARPSSAITSASLQQEQHSIGFLVADLPEELCRLGLGIHTEAQHCADW